MNIINTAIPDLKIIDPRVFKDARGYFFESWNQRDFEAEFGSITFCQDNESGSSFGTLRGIHFQQAPFAQNKLVRVIRGEVWDVAVDLRPESSTFKQWEAIVLSGKNRRQLFIPRGFGHAFLVLSEYAVFSYKVDAFYSKPHEDGVRYDDPALGIAWPLSPAELIISEKDKCLPGLSEISDRINF